MTSRAAALVITAACLSACSSVRIAVPLGHQFSVMAWAPHDGRFDTTITVAKYTGRQGERRDHPAPI